MPPPAPRRLLTRRGLLTSGAAVAGVGVAGAVAVETEMVPGRSWLYRRLRLDGADGVVPDVDGGEITEGTLVSAHRRGTTCGWAIARPPGVPADPLPVVVALHGRRQDHRYVVDPRKLAVDRYLAAAVADGVPPFAVAAVDGGDTYWHARGDGEDAGAMVVDELLPLLAEQGLDTSRVALLGWSMGGFGALHLTPRVGSALRGVAVMSPALWHRYTDTAPGAYDDAASFAALTPFGREAELDGVPLRVDCGEGDPFYAATRDYVAGFSPRPAGGFTRGDHDLGYWRRVLPDQLRFLGRALAEPAA